MSGRSIFAVAAQQVAWARTHWRETPHEFVAYQGERCEKCDSYRTAQIHAATPNHESEEA